MGRLNIACAIQAVAEDFEVDCHSAMLSRQPCAPFVIDDFQNLETEEDIVLALGSKSC
jgi:hypothetical protein